MAQKGNVLSRGNFGKSDVNREGESAVSWRSGSKPASEELSEPFAIHVSNKTN